MIEPTTDRTDYLIQLIRRLIDVIRYENQYAYELLQRVTVDKVAVIALDGCMVCMQAYDNGDYTLVLDKAAAGAVVQFRTSSVILQRIMAGNITIDKAIAENDIFVAAAFHDLFNVYSLMVCLLAEGPLNHRLRKLWKEFTETWCAPRAGHIMTIEQQKPCYDFLVRAIPEDVLLVKI